MHHADLRGEATAVIAKAAPALLYDTAVWYLVWVCGTCYGCVVSVMGVWACGCVFCGGMGDAIS